MLKENRIANRFSFHCFAIIALLICLQGCSGKESSVPRHGTGSATFSIQWPDSASIQENKLPLSASAITYIDCSARGVASIKAKMFDPHGGWSDYEWVCVDHSGTMNNLPAESGYTLSIQAVNNSGKVLFEGEKSGITIIENQNTNLGYVSLEPVDTNELTAIISSPSGPQTITVGQALNFQGSATGGTAPYTYSWNFGGGASNSSAQNPGAVTFNIAGNYTITFTVSDSNDQESSIAIAVTVTTNTFSSYTDTFDSYTTGAFPSLGGWQIIYNGAGDASQYVDNSKSTSGSQSLHLVGSTCWGSDVFHTINNIPTSVTAEAYVYINSIVSGGCSPNMAGFGLFNPSIGSWGTAYGYVGFNSDGYVYAYQSYDGSNNITLMQYLPQTWYLVKTVYNLSARTFDVYINGVLLRSGNQIMDSGTPTGVLLSANHGDNPTVWFDDVKVY